MEEKKSPVRYIDSWEPQNNCDLRNTLNLMEELFHGLDLVKNRFIIVMEVRHRKVEEDATLELS